MATTIVSGFNHEGYREYGAAFLDTYARHWPEEVKIVVYVEDMDMHSTHRKNKRFTFRSLWDINGVKKFIDEHQDPIYHGKAPVPGWSKKDHNGGESYRYDAVKFCRQLFIPEWELQYMADGDVLAWFDADCVTFADVPTEFIASIMDGKDLVTVGRDRGHTDIGFWAIKVGEQTRALLKAIADSYRNGYVLKLAEWHSGFLFDHWKDRFKHNELITHKSLTFGSGHVWFKCEIGQYTDHLKGPTRKKLGFSPERHGIRVKEWTRPTHPKA